MLFNKRDLVSFFSQNGKITPLPLKLDVEDQRSSQAQGEEIAIFLTP